MGTGMGAVSREQFGSEMTVTMELHMFLLVCARSQQPGTYPCAVLSACYHPGSLLTKRNASLELSLCMSLCGSVAHREPVTERDGVQT